MDLFLLDRIHHGLGVEGAEGSRIGITPVQVRLGGMLRRVTCR